MGLDNYENVGSFIRDCGTRILQYDQACLKVLTKENITFWSQYAECQGCKLLETETFEADGTLVLNTTSPLRYAVTYGKKQICNGTYLFGEFGQYELNITDFNQTQCDPRMVAEPDAATLPILTAVVVLLSMATLWYIVKGVGKRMAAGRFIASYFNREDNELGVETRAKFDNTPETTRNAGAGVGREDNELGAETRALTTEVTSRPTRSRLRSLDIFRGFCIALMVFVNTGGGGYTMFHHATWDGVTVADFVFPFFAFAMGEALVLSLHARLRTALPRTQAFYQVARRALVLSLIGIVIQNKNVFWYEVRFPGVLQRLAAMYLIVGAVECVTHTTTTNITPGRSWFRDIIAGWKQWLVTLILVTIQVCVTLLVAAPGCPRGYMGPGGLHMSETLGEKLKNCTGGIAGYIDRVVFGPSHIYQRGTFHPVYQTVVPHDPEGLLGILSGTLVVQAGAHATRIMLVYNHARARITRWVLWSVIMGVVGGALADFSQSGGVIPLNKNLWSVSYCLVTSSVAMFMQAVLYFAVDLKNKWGGRPLYYAGQNALFLYIFSEVFRYHFPFYIKIFKPTHAELLATNAGTMLMWLAVGVFLYKKRVFITL